MGLMSSRSRSTTWLILEYTLREFHAAGISGMAMAISARAMTMLAMLWSRSIQYWRPREPACTVTMVSAMAGPVCARSRGRAAGESISREIKRGPPGRGKGIPSFEQVHAERPVSHLGDQAHGEARGAPAGEAAADLLRHPRREPVQP